MTARTARTTRTARAAQQVAEPIDVHHTEASHEAVSDEQVKVWGHDYLIMMGVSPTRAGLVGAVLGGIAQLVGTYTVWNFLSSIALFALVGTGSMFLTFLISLIASIIACVVGGLIGYAVTKYIGNGTAERHITSAKNFVTGLFGRKPVVA